MLIIGPSCRGLGLPKSSHYLNHLVTRNLAVVLPNTWPALGTVRVKAGVATRSSEGMAKYGRTAAEEDVGEWIPTTPVDWVLPPPGNSLH